VLSYFIFKNNKILFIASEMLILISLFISWQLYKDLIKPLQILMHGVDAIRDKDFNVKFVKTGKYEMDQLITVYNHMIDELRQERTRQKEQHLFLSKLIQTSPTGILILDHDGKIEELNPKALQLLNISENQLPAKLFDDIPMPVMKEINQLKSGESKTITLNGVNIYKLQKSHFIDRGFPRYFVMIEELTAEILAAEKKAYGKVIRMMAHEVNNTIGPVNSILQSALSSGNLWQEGHASLQHALQVAIDRNQNLNLFMRNFADVARLPAPNKKKIDIHNLVYDVTKLMELRAGEKNIEFKYELDDRPLFINADKQQMEQVVINIIKNAIEAIDVEGIITLSSSPSPPQLVIIDTGSGISEKNGDLLFSPFFSTKKDGQGVGLTL
jgi:nitrogen fixation/metabolism regulation signal transduction histidine kinase